MKFYLSSFKIGSDPKKLKDLLPDDPSAVYISNGLDFAKPEKQKEHQDWDIRELESIGATVKTLDLKDYFGKQDELEVILRNIDLIYVSGGNVFDLRTAMQKSGFDNILRNLLDTNKVYAGYSAAVCVLSPTLKGYHLVDDPSLNTYGETETIWDGINLIDWQFAPHYKSDHPESDDIEKEISYLEDHGLKYKALKDGEVIIEEINA